MTFANYQSAPGINASLLAAWLTDPLDARDMLAKRTKDSKAMRDGRLLHSLVFEPRWALRQYAVRPETYPNEWPDPSGGKVTMPEWAWKKWQAEADAQLTGFDE